MVLQVLWIGTSINDVFAGLIGFEPNKFSQSLILWRLQCSLWQKSERNGFIEQFRKLDVSRFISFLVFPPASLWLVQFQWTLEIRQTQSTYTHQICQNQNILSSDGFLLCSLCNSPVEALPNFGQPNVEHAPTQHHCPSSFFHYHEAFAPSVLVTVGCYIRTEHSSTLCCLLLSSPLTPLLILSSSLLSPPPPLLSSSSSHLLILSSPLSASPLLSSPPLLSPPLLSLSSPPVLYALF